ncbi:MAG: TonB-dependent receptor, partial [Acidobacteriota bacterium]
RREILATFLLARGQNIGKPNRTSASNPTWYPHENQNLLQLHWQEKNVWGDGGVTFHFFANPNFLETRADKIAGFKSQESYSKTESTDYGAQLALDRKVVSHFRITAGLDWYGRTGAGAVNIDKYFDGQGTVTKTFEEHPYVEGNRKDVGFFFSGDYDGLKNLDLVAGVRLDLLSSRANPGGGREVSRNTDQALTGFLAGSVKLAEKFVVFANVSRAYRAPDLNERFYTGITGRGFIIANPGLTPESSLSLDAGLKFIEKRFFAGLYAFSYLIKDMIERYRVAERTYAYGNIEKGRVRGIELEWQYFPWSGFSVFGNWMLVDGQSLKSGIPLNDIPPRRLYIGSRVWVGRLSFEAEAAFQREKGDPGPAEISIPQARYVNLKASYFLAPAVNFHFSLSNLFDESYLARPDPESMEEPGRNFVFGISYSF